MSDDRDKPTTAYPPANNPQQPPPGPMTPMGQGQPPYQQQMPPYQQQMPPYNPSPYSTPVPDSSLLGMRLGALLIDSLIALPLILPMAIPILGLFLAMGCGPLAALYWLSRDAFFGGQSVGKKIVGLRVICLDGSPFTWGTSAKRNIIYAALFLMIIPILGIPLGLGSFIILNIIDIVLVVSTQKRLGDNFANTLVVRA